MSIICFAEDLSGLSRFGLNLYAYALENKIFPGPAITSQFVIATLRSISEANAKAYSVRYKDSVRLLDGLLWYSLIVSEINEQSKPYRDIYQLYKSILFIEANINQDDLTYSSRSGLQLVKDHLRRHPFVWQKLIQLSSDDDYFWALDGQDYTATTTSI